MPQATRLALDFTFLLALGTFLFEVGFGSIESQGYEDFEQSRQAPPQRVEIGNLSLKF